MMKQELILIRGLPGSGKSTIAQALRVNHHFCHRETDQYFYDTNGEYIFDSSKLKEYHQRCQKDTEHMLHKGYSVVVSNTFTQKWELEPYFKIAKEFGIIPNVLVAQNQFKNEHGVPEEHLAKMKARFEWDISDLFNKYYGEK